MYFIYVVYLFKLNIILKLNSVYSLYTQNIHVEILSLSDINDLKVNVKRNINREISYLFLIDMILHCLEILFCTVFL